MSPRQHGIKLRVKQFSVFEKWHFWKPQMRSTCIKIAYNDFTSLYRCKTFQNSIFFKSRHNPPL